MATIGLSEAAKLTGRNPSTIHRAMKTGRLSYTLGAAGERQIDTAELDRVFGIKINGAMVDAIAQPVQSNVTHPGELAALQRLLDEREATIRDLRARLDASEAERRQMNVLLTHQAGSVSSPPDAKAMILTDQQPQKRWRRRIFGRG